MSEYSARQEAWMARVASGTPAGYDVSLGWPREAYSRPVKGHWKCDECGEAWLEHASVTGAATEDDFDEGECPHCESSHVTLNMVDDWEPDSDSGDDAFSFASCDLCGSHLGGSRHAATLIPDRAVPVRDLIPISICPDCMFYVAYSDVPEDEDLTWV